MNSGIAPNALPPGQVAFARNVSFRGSFASTRPGWRKRPLTFPDATTRTRFEDALFQGASGFEPYLSPNLELVAMVGGRLFRIEVVNFFACSELALSTPNTSLAPKAWFAQAEDFLVAQNGIDAPIIYDGATVRRTDITSTLREVPTGKAMAYAIGRLWVTLPNQRAFVGSDIVYGDSGTPAYGGRDAVLKFTENDFLNGGGAFTAPLTAGLIRAMQPIANIDTSLGQGPLLVLTERAVLGVNAPFLREDWATVNFPIQSVSLLGSGAQSDEATLGVNGDVWFRARDGLRSFQVARRDFGSWVNTPLSSEMDSIIAADDANLLEHASAALFDNRLLLTATPHRVPDHGIAWRGLIALDFHNVSGISVRTAPAYDGLWTGLDILQVVPLADRCFLFALSADNKVELWEVTKDALHDYPAADSPTRIASYLDTASFGFQDGGFDRKQLSTADIWVDDLVGAVDWTAQFRPDQYPAYVAWHSWSVDARDDSCLTTCTTLDSPQPQYRTRMRLPLPSESCNPKLSMPFRSGFEFQMRLKWTGHARIKKVRLIAHQEQEDVFPFCEPSESTDTEGMTTCESTLFDYQSAP